MRCKKHPVDLSSYVGVCATCLRERLLSIIAQQDSRRGDFQLVPPPPLAFPRSVSPYISRRKSDTWRQLDGRHQLFYSTPQVGPTVSGRRKGRGFSSMIRGLFRSRSDKMDFDTGPGIPPPDSTSWFSSIIPGRRMKASPARLSDEDDGHCPARRTPRRGGGRPVGAFCLSPLVRVSPSRWMPTEMALPGEAHPSGAAAFFCKNRSRKLADPGRYSHNSTH